MRSLSPTCRVLMLLVLLVSLAPRPALAEGPARSATYKILFKEVSRLYDDLEYERALEVLGRAEREAGLSREDGLWLLMMRGVLHYVLKQQAEADAAFRRLLEQAPDARITLRSASKTLKDHFEQLRQQVLREQALAKVEAQAPPLQKQEPEPPPADTEPPPVPDTEAPPPVEPDPAVPSTPGPRPDAQPVPVPTSPPAALASSEKPFSLLLYPRLGVRGESELRGRSFVPALKTELILGTVERPWMGLMLTTVLQPSYLLRGEARAYPLDVRLSSAMGLGAHMSMGITSHPADGAWAGRAGLGLGLRLHTWRLSLDFNYERFFMSSAGRRNDALLLALEIDTGFFSPPLAR